MDDAILRKILLKYPSGHEFSLQELKTNFSQTPEADLRRTIHAHLHRTDGGAYEASLPVFHRIGADRYRVQLTPEKVNLIFGPEADRRPPIPLA